MLQAPHPSRHALNVMRTGQLCFHQTLGLNARTLASPTIPSSDSKFRGRIYRIAVHLATPCESPAFGLLLSCIKDRQLGRHAGFCTLVLHPLGGVERLGSKAAPYLEERTYHTDALI